MKPLFSIVVAILVFAANAHSADTDDIAVKELSKSKEPVVEAEESKPQSRSERCTTCSGTLSLKSQNEVLAALKNLPNSEIHTQESFEECSSEKGCAGIKLKDGKVVQKFGNLEAFKAAVTANSGNEFQFQAAGNGVFDGGVGNGGPFWWMNQNSPFKNAGAAGGAHSEKFSKFQSSSYTSSSNGGAGGVDLSANPFLNGDFKLSGGGFTSAGGNFANGQGFALGQGAGAGFGAGQGAGFSASQGGYGSNSQSSFAGAQNGFTGSQGGLSQGGLAQGGLAGAQGNYNAFNSASKFASTYTGSSPAPFASSGSNVNLIQNSQKSDFDFDQQQQTQQSIDEAFQSTGNVQGLSTGELQQTCAGQGYICVNKAQCNNGVVNANGGNLLQANTQKQYCNLRSEVCCRLETSSFSGSSSQGSGLFSQTGSGQSSFGSSTGFGSGQSTTSGFGSNQFTGSGAQFGSNFGSSSGFGTTLAPTPTRFGGSFGNDVYKSTSQSNFVDSDSFTAGSENTGIFRPGASGSGLKPGIPYLPPVDTATSGTNLVSTAFVTSPRPFTTPRPVSTPRPFTTARPTYLPPPPSTSAPTYLPPIEPLDGSETRPYVEGGILLDDTLPAPPPPPPPRVPFTPVNAEIPAGCAAALKCTPIEFCTAEGVISNTTVILTRDQDAYRVPLTDCKDIETGRIGKCCRDPFYTDPWPVNQLGKWVPDVFGGNDGRYTPDSRGSHSHNVPSQPGVTVRPPVTGSVILNNFRTTNKPILPQGPNQVTPGYPAATVTPGPFVPKTPFSQGGQGQYGIGSQGSYGRGQVGQVGVGQTVTQGQGQYGQVGGGRTVTQGQGQYGQAGVGQQEIVGQGIQTNQGAGFGITQGGGQVVRQGVGESVTRGQGFGISQGGGQVVSQGAGGSVTRGQGFGVIQSGGQGVRQGVGESVTRGQGFGVIQGGGQGVRQGVGESVTRGQGFGVVQGGGQSVTQGRGTAVSQGFGTGVTQGQGSAVLQGQGFGVQRGQGFGVTQGQGFGVTQGQGSAVLTGQGQGVQTGQGVGVITGQGSGFRQGQGTAVSQGQGQIVSQGVGQGTRIGQGFGVRQGGGAIATEGQGSAVSQGAGFGVQQGGGFGVQQGGGFGVQQGSGSGIRQGSGFGISQESGSGIRQGSGFGISQGSGTGIRQGQGFGVIRGSGVGFGYDQGQTLLQGQGQALVQGQGEQVSQESVRRVFLQRYGGSGQCGLLNPQKPYGNRDSLEVDFAEIPWQAMVLLQTNRSLLCGGVITRPDVVLTSASCVEGLEAKNVLIKGGEWKLGIDDEPLPFQIVQVKNILRHPFYKKGSLKYDAAVLVLTENLRLAKNIWPICLPSASDNLDAFYNGAGECIVTGWGKSVLQAHLQGAVMNGLNVSLINPGECQAKIQQDYPHLLDNYDQDSCVCGQPTNPANNICKVDTGSALACTTGDGVYTLRGIYSWESGCQVGNQLAAFYRFDLEWYEWSIGLIESVRFAQYTTTQITKNKVISQVTGQTFTSGVKGKITSGVKGGTVSGIKGFGIQGQSGSQIKQFGIEGQGQTGEFTQFGTKYTGSGAKFTSESGENGAGINFGSELNGPLSKTFSATFTEKKFFQSEPKYVTYTTKPEIVTFTTKPEYFTYTTKPKIVTYTTKPEIVTYTTKPEIVTYTTKPEIVTYTTKPKIVTFTTKPQIISYETSGSVSNPKYVSPGLSFSEVVGAKHEHSAQCKCLENGKK